jgi:hypothetical protein
MPTIYISIRTPQQLALAAFDIVDPVELWHFERSIMVAFNGKVSVARPKT